MARFGLTQLPRKASAHTGQQAPTYRRCFDLAVAARFPAEFANNRWTWDDADLDVIARALGMVPAAEIGKPTHAPRAAVEHAAA